MYLLRRPRGRSPVAAATSWRVAGRTWPNQRLTPGVKTGRTSRVEINLLRQYARLSDLGKYNRRSLLCVHVCNTKVIMCAEVLQRSRIRYLSGLLYRNRAFAISTFPISAMTFSYTYTRDCDKFTTSGDLEMTPDAFPQYFPFCSIKWKILQWYIII